MCRRSVVWLKELHLHRYHQSQEGACDGRNEKALAYAVCNVTVTKRNTLLKERLETEK